MFKPHRVLERVTRSRSRSRPGRPQVVAIAGASGGVGRAIARCFGQRGAAVAVLARGEAGIQAAAAEVRAAGGRAIAIPVDVADPAALAEAADRIETELGPIDVWVNVAMTSVFAPFTQISAEEFTRVTEVTYLGSVYGARVALDRMRERDRGTIVQVGSGLAYRAIPGQSAYCGAKHALRGWLAALRSELMNEGSGIRVTMVQLPAMNTPQFDWGLSRLPRQPQPVPPIYQPEVGARATVYAAEHPQRREYWVGASTVATITATMFVPGLLDRYLARTGFDSQQTDQNSDPDRAANLWEPVDSETDFGAHGRFDTQSIPHSPQSWLGRHRRVVGTAAAVGVGFVAGLTWRVRG